MKKLAKIIKLSKADELKIIRQLGRVVSIPPQQSHRNKKAYSRKQKFQENL